MFLNAKNVTSDGFAFSELNFVDQQRDELLRKGKLKRGDVVLTTRGTVGNVAYYHENIPYDHVRINSGMVIVRPDGIDENFSYQLFKSLSRSFQIFATGSAQPQLPIRDLSEIPVSIPPLPEQKAIAAVLSSLDDKIDLLQRQNATLEAMAQTLFRQWFVECRPELVEGEAENDWGEYQVRDFVTHHKQSVKPEKQPNELFHHYSIPAFDDEKTPVQELGSEIKSNKYEVVPFSILISKLNPRFPRIWDVYFTPEKKSICSTEFQVFQPNSIEYYGFVYYLFASTEVKNELTMAASGTSGSHQRVRPDVMLDVAFTIPSVDKVIEFSKLVEPNLLKKMSNLKQIRTLEKLRDTLLPKLMNGEVRVQI